MQQKWHDVCIFVDRFNREIIGYRAGERKDAQLVYRALSSIKQDLRKIKTFHTDRGNEFKNKLIDEALQIFDIQRSLSFKGSPYYVNWFNRIRIHSTLEYLSPIEYKSQHLKNCLV
ncbi:transposase [Hazenella sp. IB182353]|nr:transposase [Polycladospora coralii]